MGLPYERLMARWEICREELPYAVHYTIRWSPWGLLDRWVVNRLVPSEAGIFQLWTLKRKSLLPLTMELAYFGGLRNSLREITDNLAPAGERIRKVIDGRECWFRFSISPVRKYLEDLKSWFSRGSCEEGEQEVYVREIEELKKFPTPPPDIKLSSGEGSLQFSPLPSADSAQQGVLSNSASD